MKVVVECYHDWALARSLGIPIRQLRHQSGKGNVLRTLAKCNEEVVGIVDEDPGKPNSHPAELSKYEIEEEAHGLRLARNRGDQGKRLVIVTPRLEEWLFSHAKACGLCQSDYGLPETAAAMHRNPRYDLKPRFRDFLTAMASDAGMKLLRRWISA